MNKKVTPESGGVEQPGSPCRRGGRKHPLRMVLLLLAGAFLLPFLLPLLAVLASLVFGLFGVGVAFLVGMLALVIRVAVLALQLVLGLVGLVLGTLPWILAAFGVLYLMERLEEAEE